MTARLAAGLIVSALIRSAEEAGGNGVVLAKGDPTAGALLIQLAERGVPGPLLERRLDASGDYCWSATGPDSPDERPDYIARRRKSDPDLWVVELDVANGAKLVTSIFP